MSYKVLTDGNAGIADEAASDWLVRYAAKVRGGAV